MEDGEMKVKIERQNLAYKELENSKKSVENIISKMLIIKKEEAEGSKSDFKNLITNIFLNLLSLRQANRTILIAEDGIKAETEAAKTPVDFTTLQLHNLTYEKNHYLKAIKACKDFKSKYPDIELVPEEEFFRDAPEDIKSSVKSKDTAHDLMLKRLNYELFQRKELCKSHQKLEQQKQKLLETIASRKKFLSSLPSHLKSLKKASLPVQNQLGVLHTKKLKQHQSAELLPPPLYVIYSQFLAQKEAFSEKIDVDILGSVKEAQTFARQQANKDNGISMIQENSKMEEDPPEEEDDGQRRRKRPKKVPNKDSQSGMYLAHPLKIILHIHDDEASDAKHTKLISLKFEYLIKLNVVCVGIEGYSEEPENNILCNLFPNDTGLELPHQSSKLLDGDVLKFDIKKSLRPYKWAQHLAGIDFLPELSPLLTGPEGAGSEPSKSGEVTSGLSLYRQQNRVQTVVQRIRSRKKAQLALALQLDTLSKHAWPSLSYKSIPWASHTPLCSFYNWSSLEASPSQASTLPVTDVEQVEGSQDITMDEITDTPMKEVENNREDGELPMLALKLSLNDGKLTPLKVLDREHSKRMSLISKSMVSPMSMPKSQSFKNNTEDPEILLDFGSDLDEPALIDKENVKQASTECRKVVEYPWAEYGVREYSLILTKMLEDNKMTMKLEAKIKISMEYPLRPPYFTLSLSSSVVGENHSESNVPEWYNELRAIEAEINVRILKLIPLNQDNIILSHQVCCLAMLFDYYFGDGGQYPDKINSTSVDQSSMGGKLLARSYRGRDRQKMISWKDSGCTPDYPR